MLELPPDVDGLYVVKAYDNQILEFRLIGFATKELAVSGPIITKCSS